MQVKEEIKKSLTDILSKSKSCFYCKYKGNVDNENICAFCTPDNNNFIVSENKVDKVADDMVIKISKKISDHFLEHIL